MFIKVKIEVNAILETQWSLYTVWWSKEIAENKFYDQKKNTYVTLCTSVHDHVSIFKEMLVYRGLLAQGEEILSMSFPKESKNVLYYKEGINLQKPLIPEWQWQAF